MVWFTKAMKATSKSNCAYHNFRFTQQLTRSQASKSSNTASFKISIKMPRSVNSVASRARRKKILKQAKGYFGRRKNVWTVAKNAVDKAMLYAYRDRKTKKRNFRALWIARINAAARLNGMSYSQFMGKVKANNIQLNRKVLADLAMNHPEAFKAVVDKIK